MKQPVLPEENLEVLIAENNLYLLLTQPVPLIKGFISVRLENDHHRRSFLQSFARHGDQLSDHLLGSGICLRPL